MKTLYILFIVLLVSSSVMSQPCLPEGITFITQAQIDNFQINHPNCTEIEGDVVISGDYITNLNGLSVLTSLGGWLYICNYNNDFLANLTGLDNLTSIEGGLYIEGYNVLTSLTGLEGLTSIGQEFAIFYNASLASLTGLENLTSIGAGLYIEGNAALTSLTGLEGLNSIGEDFHIGDNTSLTSLTGLGNLTSISGWFGIEGNAALTSLTGLDSIDAGSITNLYICYNESLSTCEVQSVCDYLANPNGTIEIHDNATACNGQAEVETACENASVDELNLSNRLFIYPNPSSTQITIETTTTPRKNTSLTISSTNGQQLITQPITEPQTEIDISHLPVGIYIVKVWNDKDVIVRKIIKQ